MPRPTILVTPHTEAAGSEFPDPGVSLSHRYTRALFDAGALPWILPCLPDPAAVRDAVAQADAVMLSGGDDIHPHLHSNPLPPHLQATVVPAEGGRDLFETLVLHEVFRQRKPLLAICRGLQMLNVFLGGDLIVDLPLQHPGAPGHNRQAERFQPVHPVDIEPGSLLDHVLGCRRLDVNSTHHQAAGRVAPPLRVSARSPDGVIEALELVSDAAGALPFLLAVQFHPERLYDRFPVHARLFLHFVRTATGDRPKPGSIGHSAP
ncbi:MAG: gamma-glutamyl-gamma-aminobutyrate hydrolase family protein [Verrucomicrobiae bacterium]|nr:gamma-glutamyl-gamma-aminobutyrate hydrolase family protein [Verrucomicrobiae bacterium]